MMLLLPLILTEVYLITSLLIFAYGPIAWELESPLRFWLFIASYHIAFIFGYLLCVNKYKPRGTPDLPASDRTLESWLIKYFWAYLTLALVGTLISYKNSCHTESYLPLNLLVDFYNGLVDPGAARHEFISSMDNYKSNKVITIFYSSIAFVKYSLIPVLVFTWRKLNAPQRVIGLFVSLIPFMGTVSIGTNKLVLDTLIMFSLALFIHLLSTKKENRLEEFSCRKTIVLVIVSIAFFFPYYFNKSLSARVATFEYVQDLGKKNTIKIPYYDSPDDNILSPLIMEPYIKISTYLTQGYYGMSLAVDEKFDTTFGIGHSNFLLDQFKYFFGIDLVERTYQHKIHEDWDRLVQWHSFYSQVANDVSFYGVILIMFVLGGTVCMIFISATRDSNLIAKTILPLFVIMFVYMPANNQIFNFMESLSSFFFLILLWVYSIRRFPRVST